MYIQLFQYFTSNNLFHANQYGFRAEYSTELALSELVDRIYTDLDEKQLPIAIFIDLSKAFDTTDHTIIISKLEHYGVENNEILWFISYMHNRQKRNITLFVHIFNSIQLLYSRLNSRPIVCIQVVHNNLRSIYID